MAEDNLKTAYDKLLKKHDRSGRPFRDDKYDAYFTDDYLRWLLNEKMPKDVRKAYKEGAGKELSYGKKGEPPSMLSVASSSRFCFLSLIESDLSAFGVKNKAGDIEFEKKLPITSGTPPHMDAYYMGEEEEYFFECKCHEQFDDHPIELAASYFDKDLLVCRIPKGYVHGPKTKKVNGKNWRYFEVDQEAFGLDKRALFDIKQLLTHLMGIDKKHQKKHAKLIYFYFIPAIVRKENAAIDDLTNRLIEEIKTVFASDIIQGFLHNEKRDIELELYFLTSDDVQTASQDNVERILI